MARELPQGALPLSELLQYSEARNQAEDILRTSSGKSIKYLRRSMGMTQSFLASSLDVSQPYLSQIENGTKTPSSEFLLKLSEVTASARSGKENDGTDNK